MAQNDLGDSLSMALSQPIIYRRLYNTHRVRFPPLSINFSSNIISASDLDESEATKTNVVCLKFPVPLRCPIVSRLLLFGDPL